MVDVYSFVFDVLYDGVVEVRFGFVVVGSEMVGNVVCVRGFVYDSDVFGIIVEEVYVFLYFMGEVMSC